MPMRLSQHRHTMEPATRRKHRVLRGPHPPPLLSTTAIPIAYCFQEHEMAGRVPLSNFHTTTTSDCFIAYSRARQEHGCKISRQCFPPLAASCHKSPCRQAHGHGERSARAAKGAICSANGHDSRDTPDDESHDRRPLPPALLPQGEKGGSRVACATFR